jgi:serine/threonine protein kinase
MSDHLTDAQLSLLAGEVAGELDPESEKHLERCAACQERVDTIQDARYEQIVQPAPREVVGGHFLLGQYLGVGGFGIVRKAWDNKNGRMVAIKFPHKVADALLTEAKKAQQSQGTHVVVIHDTIPDHKAIVMEHCRGGDLARYLKSNRLSLLEAVRCFRQIVEAVAALHKRGIVHCDLKLKNILLSHDSSDTQDDLDRSTYVPYYPIGQYTLKLTDFGAALRRSADGQDDEIGLGPSGENHQGTLTHMAPEQSHGKPTRTTDVFSLGVVLFQLLTGELPSRVDTSCFPGALAAKLKESEVPKAFSDLCLRCLHDEPESRPSLDELTKVLPTPPMPVPGWRWAAISAVVGGLLMYVARDFVTRDGMSRDERTPAPQANARQSHPPDNESMMPTATGNFAGKNGPAGVAPATLAETHAVAPPATESGWTYATIDGVRKLQLQNHALHTRVNWIGVRALPQVVSDELSLAFRQSVPNKDDTKLNFDEATQITFTGNTQSIKFVYATARMPLNFGGVTVRSASFEPGATVRMWVILLKHNQEGGSKAAVSLSPVASDWIKEKTDPAWKGVQLSLRRVDGIATNDEFSMLVVSLYDRTLDSKKEVFPWTGVAHRSLAGRTGKMTYFFLTEESDNLSIDPNVYSLAEQGTLIPLVHRDLEKLESEAFDRIHEVQRMIPELNDRKDWATKWRSPESPKPRAAEAPEETELARKRDKLLDTYLHSHRIQSKASERDGLRFAFTFDRERTGDIHDAAANNDLVVLISREPTNTQPAKPNPIPTDPIDE